MEGSFHGLSTAVRRWAVSESVGNGKPFVKLLDFNTILFKYRSRKSRIQYYGKYGVYGIYGCMFRTPTSRDNRRTYLPNHRQALNQWWGMARGKIREV